MSTRIREGKQAKRQGPSLLDEVLERRMLLYVLAAGATLAGASATQAKVVVTSSTAVLTLGGSPLQIDLNNDGMTDFSLYDGGSFCTGSGSGKCFLKGGVRRPPNGSTRSVTYMTMRGAQSSNEMLQNQNYAGPAALINGARIGSGLVFGKGGLMEVSSHVQNAPRERGGLSFSNVIQRYMGVRFLINGQVHYGWIGFRSVSHFTATLMGWAYETQPNTPIRTGIAISGLTRSVEPTSLELLAAGHVAIADRRRRIAG